MPWNWIILGGGLAALLWYMNRGPKIVRPVTDDEGLALLLAGRINQLDVDRADEILWYEGADVQTVVEADFVRLLVPVGLLEGLEVPA